MKQPSTDMGSCLARIIMHCDKRNNSKNTPSSSAHKLTYDELLNRRNTIIEEQSWERIPSKRSSMFSKLSTKESDMSNLADTTRKMRETISAPSRVMLEKSLYTRYSWLKP